MSLRTVMMRGIRVSQFGGPEVLKVVSDESVPKPTGKQVLIKTHKAGVNPVDTYIRNGAYAGLPALPYIPGKDAAGTIHKVGEGVTKFKAGDRVYNVFSATGTYAEYFLANECETFRLHDHLGFGQGAAIGVPYFTAYRALVLKCRPKPGQTVLVHGASGAVGIASCQIARALGLTVLGTAGTSDGLDLVRANGAHQAFNHREQGYTEQIMAATEGRGVDITLEMLSNINLQNDIQLAAKNGQIVVIGCRGPIEINPRGTMAKELSIHGVALAHTTPEEYAEMGSFMWAGQEKGWLRPAVGKTFTLDKVADAHREVIEHTAGAGGKIVLSLAD